MGDILTFHDIYFAIDSAKKISHKSIISMAISTGMSHEELSKLTVGDFLKACKEYIGTDYGSVKNGLKKLLQIDLNDIYPCWIFSFGDNVKKVFCTPETTFYLLISLVTERKIEELRRGDALFYKSPRTHSNNNSNNNSDNSNSNNNNDEDNGFYPKESIRDNILKIKDDFFTVDLNAGSIKENFFNICEAYLDVDEEIGTKDELINLFKGTSSVDNPFYLLDNQDLIKSYYKSLVPHFSSKFLKNSSELLKSLNEETTNQYTPPNTNEDVYKHKIKDYLDNNFNFQHREGFTLQNDAKLLSYAYHLVKKDIENNKYEETEDYYDNLLKKATFYVLYRKSIDNLSDAPNFDEISSTEPQERIDMVCDYIKNMDISDFKLKDDELQKIVANQFAFHENVMGDFNEEIFEKILVSSLFEIMKNNGILQ